MPKNNLSGVAASLTAPLSISVTEHLCSINAVHGALHSTSGCLQGHPASAAQGEEPIAQQSTHWSKATVFLEKQGTVMVKPLAMSVKKTQISRKRVVTKHCQSSNSLVPYSS